MDQEKKDYLKKQQEIFQKEMQPLWTQKKKLFNELRERLEAEKIKELTQLLKK